MMSRWTACVEIDLLAGTSQETAMAKTKKRASARKKSSKRGKQSANPSRKKVAKRATSKKAKSKVGRAAKSTAKKKSPPKPAVRKVPKQAVELPIETTIINVIEEPPLPRVVVIAEPIAPVDAPERDEGCGPERKPEAA